MIVENHYGRPMDLEWANDGLTRELFLVHARPETVHSQKSGTRFTVSTLTESGPLLVTGVAIGGCRPTMSGWPEWNSSSTT